MTSPLCKEIQLAEGSDASAEYLRFNTSPGRRDIGDLVPMSSWMVCPSPVTSSKVRFRPSTRSSLMFSCSIALELIETDRLSMLILSKIWGRSSTTLIRLIVEVPTFSIEMLVCTTSSV